MAAQHLVALRTAEQAAAWLRARVTGTLRADSRAVRAGDGFVAWPGRSTDGRRFVAAALDAGAAACLVEAEGVERYAFDDERIATLPGLKAGCGALADLWFGAPGRRLAVVATTGTNGKTSTAWWVAQALSLTGRRAGVIGTLGVGEPPALRHTGLTTPDPLTLHGALRGLADGGCTACAIEASSIGLVEERLNAVAIAVAAFTNFTRDHLDYHGTMQAYWAAKRRLFDWPGLRAAVVNVDDGHGATLAAELQAAAAQAGAPQLWTVALHAPARLRGGALAYDARGLVFDVVEEGGARARIASALVGEYNASNLLVVLGVLRALGVPLADAAAALGRVTPVPGRMQRVAGGGIEVVVDYAHTPDALEQVLAALRPLAAARGAKLWCVFGCGGDRDATKRPLMGEIAARLADAVVLTSDNPRGEAPQAILAQIAAGIGAGEHVEVIEDRREAIAHAVRAARPGDVVLVAGKGHEDYQEVAGERRPFSDVAEAEAALARRAGMATGSAA